MEDNKDTAFLTEEETKKIVSEQFEKLAPSFFQKTLIITSLPLMLHKKFIKYKKN